MKVGDRVSWIGWFNFGTESRRVTGAVVKVGLGIPAAYREEGEVGTPSYRLIEERRAPAVQVEPDGYVPKPHDAPIIVAIEDLQREVPE